MINNIFTYSGKQKEADVNEYSLWIDVIKQAVEDIVLIDVLLEEGKELKEDILAYRDTAEEFLFNPQHKINFDDYLITYTCNNCKDKKDILMSKFTTLLECPNCKQAKFYYKNSDYIVKEVSKEIDLKELLSLFDINNIDNFREVLKNRIEILKNKKRKQRKVKQNRKK